MDGLRVGAAASNAWRPSIGLAVGIAALLAVVTGFGVSRMARFEETPRAVTRFSLHLPATDALSSLATHAMALSADGTRLVYGANGKLFVRSMDDTESTELPGTEGAREPFFSPDGEWVGFFADGALKKLPLRGGVPARLCDAESSFGARWEADDTIVFGNFTDGIVRVSSEGGTPEVLVPASVASEVSYGPQVLPGGKAVLFTLGESTNWHAARIVARSLETGETNVVVERGRDARYLPNGRLVYVVDGTLTAAPFDVDTLELTGAAVPIVENLLTAPLSGAAQFSISDSGTLIYVAGDVLGTRTLVWVDREGREQAIAAEPQAYTYLNISPDGGRAAIDLRGLDNDDIWIWYFEREALVRLTFAPGREIYPVWTRDGNRLAFASDRDGFPNLFWKSADGTGAAERLSQSEQPQFPTTFTPDGTQVVYHGPDRRAKLGFPDLWVQTIGGSASHLLAADFQVRNADISPDGRWLAYQSDASGQFEIYVRSFPNVDEGQWPISSGGGTRPRWSRSGRELFYVNREGGLVAVEVVTDPDFAPGKSEELFRGYYAPHTESNPGRTYDVSPDGERFLMIKESSSADSAEFVVVLNWFEELKQLVPANE